MQSMLEALFGLARVKRLVQFDDGCQISRFSLPFSLLCTFVAFFLQSFLLYLPCSIFSNHDSTSVQMVGESESLKHITEPHV